jgi:indole-3-glycerol phosphate synthase
MSDRLAPILASRRRRVEELRGAGLAEELRREAERRAREIRPLGFEEALRTGARPLVAEVKRRSPSAGPLAGDGFDPVALARSYAAAGAAAISVVVERDHFDGDPAWVPAIAAATGLPVLWKDFVVDELILDEAKAGGASAVLLIVAALDDATLRRFHRRAEELELSVLVETHSEDEGARAIDAGARIVGVNSRNLSTFEVDLAVAERVVRTLPAGVLRVAESGIRSRDDVRRLRDAGFDAFLVGETLVRSGDPSATVARLFGE